MKPIDTLAILGVGLLGGSIGRAAIERKAARKVVGIGRRPAMLAAAERLGAATETTTSIEMGVAEADLIVVCTPVDRIVDSVREVARFCPEGALITDVGSTKREIVRQLGGKLGRNVRFLGSHPVAGSEKSGVDQARGDLFEGQRVILTPTRSTKKADVELLKRFWKSLGAETIAMSPERHDQIFAAVSHLPHLVAAALAGSISASDLKHAAAGWLDTTRVASGDAELWTPIFSTNRDGVLKALARFEKTLTLLRDAIERDDGKALTRLLTAAKRNRDALGS
jgi:prephenate dehydrogenase